MLKKYSKLILVSLICLSIICSYSLVSAKEVSNSYFTNENGVSLTKEEYDFLTKMYWDGYQKIMTQDEYNKFKENDIINGEFDSKVVTVGDNNLTRGTTHTTASKSLKVSKSCSSNCLVAVTLTWLGQPTIRSYDVMGSYLSSVTLQSNPNTRVSSSTSTTFPTDIKKSGNNFGVSFKLPSGSNLIINQDFYASKGGRVYSSYQHAMSNTTLATSKSYTFSLVGYGGVFNFTGNARNVYDAMNGVDIDL